MIEISLRFLPHAAETFRIAILLAPCPLEIKFLLDSLFCMGAAPRYFLESAPPFLTPSTPHIHGAVRIGVQGGKPQRNWEHPQHTDTHPHKDKEGSVTPSTPHPAHAQPGQQALILKALDGVTD